MDQTTKLVNSGGKRVLINEILSLQILITAVIGALAIAGLYWGGQWVLQKNYSRWALQWTEELHELGAPLYLPDDQQVGRRLDMFISRYPEIERVTYFRLDGSAITSLSNSGVEDNPSESHALDAEQLERVSSLVGADTPYLIDSTIANVRAFEIFAPIWTESIANDGLFEFDPLEEESASALELVGFVGLELDFTEFHDNLLGNIKLATLALIVLLIFSGFIGRLSLRRALRAISDLQHPIAELAKGNLAVRFKPAAHREISEIVEALETTAKELGERDAKLLQLANHDPLTGLFNRRRFVEELEQILAADNGVNRGALLFIDLDQFKYVNDTCGHPAGDRLIRKVAEQLEKSVGDSGIVARFGGDEFAVLLYKVAKRKVTEIGEQILEDMRKLVHVEDTNAFHVHCSIGATMIRRGIGDHDDLIARADIACREAKSRGRNRLEFYKVSRHEAEQMAADVGWMRRIREAVDNDAFLLRYQPIASVQTGEVSHHEVLLRMRTENGQLIGPDVFLPAAIRFGLMAEIDAWMIRNVIAQLAELESKYPDVRLAVNLSANAFETENLSSYVHSQLKEHDVEPGRVLFEITENLAVRHLSHVEQQITELRKLGCAVALDDFGKGYSSLSHLQQLSVDYIKIDGTFIQNIGTNTVDQKMVRLIGEIGSEAGMKTVAEYVQNAAAFSMLAELGIDYAQGNYVGKPLANPSFKAVPVPLSAKRRSKRTADGKA